MERFAAGHGGLVGAELGGDVVRLGTADGTSAGLAVPWPPLPAAGEPLVAESLVAESLVAGPSRAGSLVAGLVAHAAAPRTALVLLVRRGGYSAGIARDGALLDSTTGTRYVQSRTAAGGWSQQRYARRRTGQAAVLAGAAADAVVRLLARAAAAPHPLVPRVLVPGGDRLLVAEVLTDPRLAAAAALPAGPLLDVPDPRAAVLAEAARRARAVRVLVRDA